MGLVCWTTHFLTCCDVFCSHAEFISDIFLAHIFVSLFGHLLPNFVVPLSRMLFVRSRLALNTLVNYHTPSLLHPVY